MELGTIILIVVAVIVVLLILWLITGYNGFVSIRNKVEEAFATMDVYLKKRYDLIPNLVETVKGYASHEQDTLEKVIQARNSAMGAQSVNDRVESENQLSGVLKSIFALAESYPDLKANTNFMDLQNQLQKIEEDIAQSRKYYNAIVKEYKNKKEMFPSSIIGGIFHFPNYPFFNAAEEERANVKVSFDK